MKIIVNAIPLRPGGGLTVLLGVLRGLRMAEEHLDITVLVSDPATLRAVNSDGHARRVICLLENAGSAQAFVWQNSRLGQTLHAEGADILLTINHHLRGVACHQVVYHLNLHRFCRHQRSAKPWHRLQEFLRDRAARNALLKASANVFESRFLQQAAEDSIPAAVQNPHVIYAGMAEELLALVDSSKSGIGGVSRRIMAITNPLPHKDNPTLLRTLAALVARAP